MPKVSEGHIEKKRQQILEAAKRVCESKPLYSVTMKDIVTESGMSQGGVYKYFPNIDAVFVSILNEATLSHRIEADVEAILNSGVPSFQRITELIHYLGQYIADTVNSNREIFFEIMTLYANEPTRFMEIKDQLVEVSVLDYLQRRLSGFILQGVADKTFVPAVPLEDLFGFVMVSLNGITQAMISANRLAAGGRPAPTHNLDGLVRALAVSVLMLLGGIPDLRID